MKKRIFFITLAVLVSCPSLPTIDKTDVYRLTCYTLNGQSGDELIALVKQAVEKKALLVFLFHGIRW